MKYNYQKDDLIELLEDKRVAFDMNGNEIVLHKGTLVYINELNEDYKNTLQINVSEIDSDLDFWLSAENTKLVERAKEIKR